MDATAAPSPPTRIVLATDLSHRCDRALDRAVQLGRQWQAGLLALTVLERQELRGLLDDAKAWDQRQREVEAHALASATLRQDLDEADLDLRVQVGRGDPAEFVLGVLAAGDLAVTGIARSGFLQSIVLGSTTERIVRRSPVPVLVVRRRGRQGYGRLVVGSDFSTTSAHALRTALALFPDAVATLFHACQPPLAGLIDSDLARTDFVRGAQAEARDFLDGLGLDPADRERITIEVEFGAPESSLRDFAAKAGSELVVVGSHGRSAVFEALIGSTAKRVLEIVDADVLLVPEPRARG